MTPAPATANRVRKGMSKILRQRRMELVTALFAAIRDTRTATWKQELSFDEIQPWGKSQLLTTVDLLEQWFETSDPLFQELFDGWIRSRMISDLSSETLPEDYKPDQALQIARAKWVEILRPASAAHAIEVFEQDLESSITTLAKLPLKDLKILFIGDCVQFEILSSMLGPCSQAQVHITGEIQNEKVQALLRNRIRALPSDQFDLVFFSPFSYTYLPEYAILLNPKSFFWPARKTKAHLDQMFSDITSTVETLVSHFDCKIYVHNTSATIQSFGRWSGLAKNVLSWAKRRPIRRAINERIRHLLESPRFSTTARVQLLDEDSLRKKASDFELGKVYFQSNAFHPTRLGVELGRDLYFEAVYANTFLATKKVIVCDLDNTLWDGVIGEGAVKHFLDRQDTLLELKRRGVLLSINSKNDPKNVHWAAARLEAADFVSPQINWEPKINNMARIRDDLNLKLKDFVFIDDRPDELERMRTAYPDLLALDATKDLTWKLLSHWKGLLPPTPNEDRTKLYHERVNREQFVSQLTQTSNQVEDETAALRALGLSVNINEAKGSDLKRAVELINRTNQFNLCGSRTTLRELQEGLGTTHSVITVEASDKFGNMGVVGIMMAAWNSDQVEIPIFVLSCRVFGYGIEYVLLNSLKNLVPQEHRILGHYKETQHNEPCRKLYSESGLIWDGQYWVGKVSELPAASSWVAVQNQIKKRTTS